MASSASRMPGRISDMGASLAAGSPPRPSTNIGLASRQRAQGVGHADAVRCVDALRLHALA
jgi:hypothetical protein